LPFATEAPFNSYSRQHEPTCLKNTRVDVLKEIYNWADGQDKRCIFWLKGLAGTGKSTIARTVARTFSEHSRLGASFFFSRGGGDIGHAGKFITSIAMQLATTVPTLSRHIRKAITEHGDIASQSLYDQWRQLILGPLSKVEGRSRQSSYVLVIDALDECNNENDIRVILRLLAEAGSLRTAQLRVLLTSRPEIPIRHGILQLLDSEHHDFVLHHMSPMIIDHEIATFLGFSLKVIAQERSLDLSWPDEDVITPLVQNASGLFIWAATACRFIRDGRRFASERLAMILESSSKSISAPEKNLDEIYITVLSHCITTNYTNEEKEEVYRMLKRILGSIIILSSPLSADSLSKLLHIQKQDVNETLEDLHSILDIPEERTRPLRLHHPSFRDFLLSKERCGDPHLRVEEKQAHQALADNCIRLMSIYLKQDICGLDVPGSLVSEVESSLVEQCLPPEVQYACLYWVQHV
jgi:hypothetical protein